MLFESELTIARRVLNAFKARAGAEGAALIHVDGSPLTPWDGSKHEPSTVSALAAAGFAATVEIAKLLLAAKLNSMRLGADEEVIAVEALSRTVLLVVHYDLSRTKDDAVTAQFAALRDELRPILERLDTRRGEDHGGRLATLRPGDPPRAGRPRRDAAQ